MVIPLRFVFFSVGILGVRLEVKKIGTNRSVTILKSGQRYPILHLRHFGTDKNRQSISRCTAPRGVPRPTHALADSPRLIDM